MEVIADSGGVVRAVPHTNISSASAVVWCLNTSVKSIFQLRFTGLSLPIYSLMESIMDELFFPL